MYPNSSAKADDFMKRPRRVKVCSSHFRGFMLAPANRGFTLARMPTTDGSEGARFMPGSAFELDALEATYGACAASTNVAPRRPLATGRKSAPPPLPS